MIFKHTDSDFSIQLLLDGKLALRKKDSHMGCLGTIQEVKAFICGYREREQEEEGRKSLFDIQTGASMIMGSKTYECDGSVHGREDKNAILPEWTPWDMAQPSGNDAWIDAPQYDGVLYGFKNMEGHWSVVCIDGEIESLLVSDLKRLFWKPITK